MTTSELEVDGMTCGHCQRAVEEALRGVDGVTNATVDLRGRRATISFDPERANVAGLTVAVERAGYRASELNSGIP